MIKVLFFGSLQDVAATAELILPHQPTPSALINALDGSQPQLANALRQPQVMVAVNQVLASLDSPLEDGDEVAFMPPVTGG